MRVKDHALVRIVLSVAILAAVLFASDVATAKDATAAAHALRGARRPG